MTGAIEAAVGVVAEAVGLRDADGVNVYRVRLLESATAPPRRIANGMVGVESDGVAPEDAVPPPGTIRGQARAPTIPTAS